MNIISTLEVRRCRIGAVAIAVAILLFLGNSTFAQTSQVVIPPSSIEKPEDVGKRFHTNVRWLSNGSFEGSISPQVASGQEAIKGQRERSLPSPGRKLLDTLPNQEGNSHHPCHKNRASKGSP
jgi:hypothetical protein